MEEKSLDPVSLALWPGSEKDTVPSEARCGAYGAVRGHQTKCGLWQLRQQEEAGSRLSHHAAGFGVSLGREPRASKASEASDASPVALWLKSPSRGLWKSTRARRRVSPDCNVLTRVPEAPPSASSP